MVEPSKYRNLMCVVCKKLAQNAGRTKGCAAHGKQFEGGPTLPDQPEVAQGASRRHRSFARLGYLHASPQGGLGQGMPSRLPLSSSIFRNCFSLINASPQSLTLKLVAVLVLVSAANKGCVPCFMWARVIFSLPSPMCVPLTWWGHPSPLLDH